MAPCQKSIGTSRTFRDGQVRTPAITQSMVGSRPGCLFRSTVDGRDPAGALVNITPLDPPTPTFEHPGPVAEFRHLPEEIHLVLLQHLRAYGDSRRSSSLGCTTGMDIHRTCRTLRSRTCCSKLRRYRLNGQREGRALGPSGSPLIPRQLAASAVMLFGVEIEHKSRRIRMRKRRGERVLPAAIIELFVLRSDGELEPLTEGSTRPIASTVTHGGICRVTRYAFDMS
jgi:hypothetical protein